MTDLTELTDEQIAIVRGLLDKEWARYGRLRAEAFHPESDVFLTAQLRLEEIQRVFTPIEEPYRYLTGEDVD